MIRGDSDANSLGRTHRSWTLFVKDGEKAARGERADGAFLAGDDSGMRRFSASAWARISSRLGAGRLRVRRDRNRVKRRVHT